MRNPASKSISGLKSQDAAPYNNLRFAAIGVGAITAAINVLYLTGSFFMLEVYDRVIPARSLPSLVVLAILAAGLYGFQGILDIVRSRLLVRVSSLVDEAVSGRALQAVVRMPLVSRGAGAGLQPLRDLDQLRGFLCGTGPGALFDLPWMPFYLAICFMFHVWIGVTALAGGLLLVGLTILVNTLTRTHSAALTSLVHHRTSLAEAGRRNAEALKALGMAERVEDRWQQVNTRYRDAQRSASDIAGGFGALSKVLRMALQSGVLAVGAYLVIEQQATAGIIIASSVLTSRALAPVELAIANWKSFVAARDGWRRLRLLLAEQSDSEPLQLPPPERELLADNVGTSPPGRPIVVDGVSFRLVAGSGLGIIGPSASGKSTLARAIVGVWPLARGSIRLDGATLDQWHPRELGRHLGYLPQDVELFSGTVAANVARFEPNAVADDVIAAATAAGVHDLILNLANGYDTQIGEAGSALSAGQRQRIGLARALYGNPFLVVLDEPNSNLDSEGEHALTRAMLGIRARGGIVIVVAHRPSALAAVDLVMLMAEGRAQAFGPKEEVLGRFLRPVGTASRSTPLRGAGVIPAAGAVS